MEGPGNKGLTNFTSVNFTGASATIGGQTGVLGSFAGADPITMTNNSVNTVDERSKKSGVPKRLVGIGELDIFVVHCTGFMRFPPIPCTPVSLRAYF